jgi:hypothetical protein
MRIYRFKKYFKLVRTSARKLFQVIILCLWILTLLARLLIHQNDYTLSSSSDLPAHTLIDYDLISPEKLFYLQNETERITENLKVQSVDYFYGSLLLKNNSHYRRTCEISAGDRRIFSFYVFIETTNPRSPPTSFI